VTLQATPERALLSQRFLTPTPGNSTGGMCLVASDEERQVYAMVVGRDSSPISHWHSVGLINDVFEIQANTYTKLNVGSGSRSLKHVRVFLTPRSKSEVALSVSQRVSAIRSSFGLNMTQLARVLQVARVTVYEWIRLGETHTLHEASRTRLDNVYRCAKTWQSLSCVNGSYLQEFIPSLNTTVEQLLCGDELDANVFIKAHNALIRVQNNPARKQALQQHQIKVLDAAAKGIMANAQKLGVVLD